METLEGRAALRVPVVAPLLLLLLALLLLAVGDHVLLGNTSGYESPGADPGLALLAGLAATGGLFLALWRAETRRAYGAALLALAGLLVLVVLVDDGFRFVWQEGEAELNLFLGGSVLLGLVLVSWPGHASAGDGLRPEGHGGARLVGWLVATVVATWVAFQLGSDHFYRQNCTGPDFDGECDIAAFEGILWAGVTVLAMATLTLVDTVRQRRRRPPG